MAALSESKTLTFLQLCFYVSFCKSFDLTIFNQLNYVPVEIKLSKMYFLLFFLLIFNEK